MASSARTSESRLKVSVPSVEVAVTHFVDDYKLALIEQRGVAAIEIDVSLFRDATFAALETALFDDPSRTRWLYHPQVTSAEADLLASIKDKLDAAEMSAAYRSYSRAQMEEVERAYRLAERERDAEQEQVQAEERRVEAEQDALRRKVAEEARRKQRHETLKKASAFKARPEDHKRLILLHRLGLSDLPKILGANVRGAMSFGVADPLVWQTTLFGGLIHKQAAEGHGWIATNFARAWMRYRFSIPPTMAQSANNAIDEYLMNLSTVGALIPCKNAFFAIAVADLAALETLDAVRKDRNFDPARFQWVPRDKWPGAMQVGTLTEAMIPNEGKARAWMNLARNLGKHYWRHPLEVCQWASDTFGREENVADYLIRTGYLCIAPTSESAPAQTS